MNSFVPFSVSSENQKENDIVSPPEKQGGGEKCGGEMRRSEEGREM